MIYSKLIYLFWVATVLVMAWAQADIIPALRQYVPPASGEATKASRALHVGLTVVYCLPLALAPWLPVVWWKWGLAAGLARLWFDPALNVFGGVSALYLGQTAGTDKLLRKLSPSRPELVGLVLRVGLFLAGIICLFI